MSTPRHRFRATAGFTLLEAAVVVAIVAIVAAAAIPSYSSMLARQQLRLAGEALAADLRMAREESLRLGQPVYVSYQTGPAWCWGVSRGQPCSCGTGVPACSLRHASAQEFSRVSLAQANGVVFTAATGRVDAPARAAFESNKNHRLQVLVNALGRSSVCGPDAPIPSAC